MLLTPSSMRPLQLSSLPLQVSARRDGRGDDADERRLHGRRVGQRDGMALRRAARGGDLAVGLSAVVRPCR